MCGRYVLTDLEKFLQRQAWIRRPEPTLLAAPRYNIAPQQEILAVVRDRKDPGHGVVKPFRWGLVPSWAKDESVGSRMINARCETVAEKGSFRNALARRRCLIPADAFYEWRKPEKAGGLKQPYAIRRKGDEPFAFAGLWEVWHDPKHADRPPLFTCTIITCDANPLVADLHDRMPVILPESSYGDWVDVERVDPEEAIALLQSYPAEAMYAFPVGRRVGNVANEGPSLLEPEPMEDPSRGAEPSGGEPSLF